MHAFHRTLTQLAVAAVLAVSAVAHAQSAAPAPTPAPIDAEKQKLIDHLLTIWHPENGMLMLVQRPAANAMDQSKAALQRAKVPTDKGEKVLKDISTDVQKYFDASKTAALASTKKNLGSTVVPMLAQNFTSEELRQLIAALEAPAYTKFGTLEPQMERALGEKVTADAGPEVNKNIDTMNKAILVKLQAAGAASAQPNAK